MSSFVFVVVCGYARVLLVAAALVCLRRCFPLVSSMPMKNRQMRMGTDARCVCEENE